MKKPAECPIELLHEYFECNFETGQLFRKKAVRGKRKGSEAGSRRRTGYYKVHFFGRDFARHRIVWAMYNGAWPSAEVDHINNTPGDDGISNLRLATPGQNRRNRGKQRNNSSGYKGVVLYSRPGYCAWRAVIQHEGKQYTCGYFKTPEEAHRAYRLKAKELHGEFARSGT